MAVIKNSIFPTKWKFQDNYDELSIITENIVTLISLGSSCVLVYAPWPWTCMVNSETGHTELCVWHRKLQISLQAHPLIAPKLNSDISGQWRVSRWLTLRNVVIDRYLFRFHGKKTRWGLGLCDSCEVQRIEEEQSNIPRGCHFLG